jgi:AcrR family transcriptional regulator
MAGAITETAKISHSMPLVGGPTASRKRVLRSAFLLFCDRGFGGTSMLQIATEAKVSKRDLYALYANKHALLADCIGERAREMRRLLDPSVPVPATAGALAEMLIEIGSTILRAACRPDVLMLYRLAIAESDRAPEIARLLDTNGREDNFRAMTEFLAKAQASGLIAAGDPAALAARYNGVLWGDMLVRLLLRVREAPDAMEVERRARTAAAALIQAPL